MERKTEERSTETARRISIRRKVMQVLARHSSRWPFPRLATLQEANLPDTSSFLIIVRPFSALDSVALRRVDAVNNE